jgi:hypothetical protein
MATVGKIISVNIEEEFRKIFTEPYSKYTDVSNQYTDVSNQILPPGIDSSPVENDQGVSIVIDGNAGKSVLVGVYPDLLAEKGETRIYSRDADGIQVAEIFLKKDGTITVDSDKKVIVNSIDPIELNGNTDNAVRFTKLKDVVDEIQSDIADLKTVIGTTWVVVPNDGGAALKAAAATWAGTALIEDIDDSKVDEVKLP